MNSPHSADSGSKSRVLLVDDHPVVRLGLAQLINATSDLLVCGEASTGREALNLWETTSPDVAVVDISLEDRNGIEVIGDMVAQRPGLPCLALSMYDETVYALRALKAGGRGYIMKQEPPRKVLEAIRIVLAGNVYLSQEMSNRFLNHYASNSTSPLAPSSELSRRELEILMLIGRGQSTGEIAKNLFLSVKTVAAHRERIKEKLKLENANELLRYAMQFALDGASVTTKKPID
jgi:DNA-binding NarL/FixJ family response regulator